MKKYLIKILWSVVVLISISACSSSDDVSDDGRFPSDEDIAEVLKSVNTEWGTSKEAVRQHMNGYQMVESSDESILQFNAKTLPVTFAYQFASDKLCAAVVMARKGEESVDIKKSLDGFSYVGESGCNEIFSNKDKNVFAAAYETVDKENRRNQRSNFHLTSCHFLFIKFINVIRSIGFIKDIGKSGKESLENFYNL